MRLHMIMWVRFQSPGPSPDSMGARVLKRGNISRSIYGISNHHRGARNIEKSDISRLIYCISSTHTGQGLGNLGRTYKLRAGVSAVSALVFTCI